MGHEGNGNAAPASPRGRPRAPSVPIPPRRRSRGLSSSSLVWDGYEPDPEPLPDDVYPRVIPDRRRTLGFYIAMVPITCIWAITPAS